MMTRVVLADDHAVVRAGIRHLLNRAKDIDVVGEAGNGIEALNLVAKLQPDVLLLDMEMPLLNGLEVAKKMQENGSRSRILVLSVHDDRQFVMAMLASGAAGYLSKDDLPENVVDAVRGVSSGEVGWVSPRIASSVSSWMQERGQTARFRSGRPS